MKTEQEKYYERKNRQAKELEETLPWVCFGIVIFALCYWLWPVWLFFAVIAGIGYIIKSIKDTIVESTTTVFNFIFRRKQINKDLLDLLDSVAILMMLLFVIVLGISITLK